MDHYCLAAPFCLKKVSKDLAACKDHWFMLPKELRERVWNLFLDVETRGQEAHLQALKEAKEYLHRMLDQARPRPDGDALDPALDL